MLNDISKDSEERMKKCVQSLETAFNRIRTGRAHPSILDAVLVHYYGADMPIQQVANVVVEDGLSPSLDFMIAFSISGNIFFSQGAIMRVRPSSTTTLATC